MKYTYKHQKLIRGSSICLTGVDRNLINLIIECLSKRKGYIATLTEIYDYIKIKYEHVVNASQIKYLLMILLIRHRISITNRKKNKSYRTAWHTKVRLLPNKTQIIKQREK